MRVPLDWLKEYVDITTPLPELAERLTLAGLEVAAIEQTGADWEPDKIVVGQVLQVERHPNADRLTVVTVDHGADEPQVVVTGAPNIRVGDSGVKVAFGRTGARVIDGHSEELRYITIKPSKIRGVPSAGMVLSEKELGLSTAHEGIMVLDQDAPVGMPLGEYLGRTVLDIDLTPNLSRALSMIGTAREVSALGGGALHVQDPSMNAEGAPIAGQVEIEILDPDLCARYSATLIRGVQVGESPRWMQERLRAAGMRPINNIVDITNYVMLEWGQPLHAFDYDKLHARQAGGPPAITVRRARSDERMTTLDGVERILSPDMLLITDGAGPVALAGIMGGLESEVTATTTNVLLEAANFNYINNRRTSELLGLPSEASLRFGRGVPAELTIRAATRASELMRELAGGTIADGIVDVYPVKQPQRTIDTPASEVRRLLGMDLSRKQIAQGLEAFGFGVREAEEGDRLQVDVPYYRIDVEIAADLVEEVARYIGYDKIPSTLLRDELPPQRDNPSLQFEQKVRDILVGCGLTEVITYSLTNLESVARLNASGDLLNGSEYVAIANPLTPERRYMRKTLMNSLLETLRDNLRFQDRVAIFEVGRVYLPVAGQDCPNEPRYLGAVMSGNRYPSSWSGPKQAEIDFYDLKGVVETLLQHLHLSATFALIDHPTFQIGRVASVAIGDQQIGVLGEVAPAVREQFDLSAQRVALLEIDLEALQPLIPTRHYEPVSRFPAVTEALAIIVDAQVPEARVRETIREGGGRLLRQVQLFDLYQGEQIPPGKKSLAYELSYQAMDRTLTEKEVIKLRERILRKLQSELGAQVRTSGA